MKSKGGLLLILILSQSYTANMGEADIIDQCNTTAGDFASGILEKVVCQNIHSNTRYHGE